MSKPSILLAMLACGLMVIASASVYWKFSPFISLSAMSSAIEKQNAADFETYMDYQRLRESVAKQLRAKINEGVPIGSGDFAPISPLSRDETIAEIVEAAVRPEPLMRALATGSSAAIFQPESMATLTAFADSAHGGTFTGWEIEHIDPNMLRAYATVSGIKQPHVLSFVFQRNGFADWKIVDFVLPTARSVSHMVQSQGSATMALS